MKMFTQVKIAIAGILVLAIAGLFWRYEYVVKKLDSQTIELAQAKINAETLQKQLIDADNERKAYLAKIEESKNETDDLRGRVNSGATILRVKADCTVPKTSTDTSGTITASPELTEDARQDYYSLRQGIAEVNARLELCVKTLQDERQ
jgi:prophage endopeptidase